MQNTTKKAEGKASGGKKSFKERLSEIYIYWIDPLFIEDSQYLRAGSLTYYSFVGLVPFFSFLLWLGNALDSKVSLDAAGSAMVPTLQNTIAELCHYAQVSMDNMKTTWVGWIVLIIIIWMVFCTFNNLEKIFNLIWNSERRQWNLSKGNRGGTVLVSMMVTALVTYACAAAFTGIGIKALGVTVTLTILWLFMSLAFYCMPYDKKPEPVMALLTAFATTILVAGWTALLPLTAKYIATYQADGLLVFLLVFWMYWAWFIIVTGVKFCRLCNSLYMEKATISEKVISWKEINGISPLYRCYLSLMVTSVILKKSLEEDRKKDSVSGKTQKDLKEESAQRTFNGIRKAFGEHISTTLLNEIIEYICEPSDGKFHQSAGIIKRGKRENNRNDVVYEPNMSLKRAESYTIGEFLYDYNIKGGSISKLGVPAELSRISDGIIDIFGRNATERSLRLIDLDIERFVNADHAEDFAQNCIDAFGKAREKATAMPPEEAEQESVSINTAPVQPAPDKKTSFVDWLNSKLKIFN